jgi:hypothetical protein
MFSRSTSFAKGLIMALIARIIGMSLLTGGLGAVLGLALFGHYIFGPYDDKVIPAFLTLFLAFVGGLIGAIAGAAREIVTALRQKPDSDQTPPASPSR